MTTDELAFRHGCRLREWGVDLFQATHQAKHYVAYTRNSFFNGYYGRFTGELGKLPVAEREGDC